MALEHGFQIAVTTPVIAEWWREGRREKGLPHPFEATRCNTSDLKDLERLARVFPGVLLERV